MKEKSLERRYTTLFVSFSLKETIKIFVRGYEPEDGSIFIIYHEIMNMLNKRDEHVYICIDLANGHMSTLLKTIKDIKNKYGDKVVIMSGNIANPATYEDYEKVGCDYVRCGIGGGSGCLTASNTGVFFPSFSLLKEIYEVKKSINGNCKIIADGGIKGYRDVQKALIYSDYVMIGGLFNKCIESAGLTTYGKSYIKLFGFKVRNYIKDFFYYGEVVNYKKYDKLMKKIKNGMLELNKSFYGMSTKIAQEETGNKVKKTSEGKIITNKVEYTIHQWAENEESYLRSAMSYVNAMTLDEYKESQWVQINKITYNN
jgi:tRNA-dihydrouridine synthase